MNKEDFAGWIIRSGALFSVKSDSLISKSIEILNAFHPYYKQYINEYTIYSNMLTEKEKLYGELYNKYRYGSQRETRTKVEIEANIYSDETYYKLCLAINAQEQIVKYFEGVCDNIKKIAYSIKNIVDLKNLGMQA